MPKQDRRQIYPKFSKKEINKAASNLGRTLKEHGFISASDEDIVENWRASHTHILNTWQVVLRNRIKGNSVIFAQRLKRKNTIYDKLERFPDMQLARMHDIAGCRLIFKNEADMLEYISKLHKATGFHHIRKEGQYKDYITNPKESGYRGIHDVYAYQSKKGYDRSDKWNGLLVEIQYRTIYQHAWATAVEVADYLTNCRAKFSQGNSDQQEFFRYASEIIARAYENRVSCKNTLSNQDLIANFKKLEQKTNLLQRLKQLKSISKIPEIFKQNLVIHFTIKDDQPKFDIYGFNSLPVAGIHYFILEKNIQPMILYW